ncbi:MAG: flagellar motor switch protein FliN [Butyricicoccus pullicaecorum]|nr:flagellar motor switch protein FliN [Butyricicoccus pullicaecorum]MDO4668588.1 flagellar motor switch protein FliN [Butyricicoccus pullicaecorum]
MDPQNFSTIELDAIGEVLNISLGSSATAVSNMLNRRVDITTPTVHVLTSEEFELGRVDPAVGVEITYVSGLSGRNIMLLRRQDVRAVVDILMGQETADEDFVMDELSMSAICEVMNQMMGASATALSEFLGKMVNISTPTAFEIRDLEEFRTDYFPHGHTMVVVRFNLSIEGAMESEFMNVMPCALAKELIGALGVSDEEGIADAAAPEAAPVAATPETASAGGMMSQDEMEKMMTDSGASAPASAGGVMSQSEIEKLMGGMASAPQTPAGTVPIQTAAPASGAAMPSMAAPAAGEPNMATQTGGQVDSALLNQLTNLIAMQQQQMQQMQQVQMHGQQQNKVIQVDQPMMPHFASGEPLGEEQAQNLDLIMSVPLEVSVEIGRTKRLVKDILGFTKGSLVVLDTLAGDQVNLFVNGQCVARGDVVVVEDNFGIRVTEILQKPDLGILAR